MLEDNPNLTKEDAKKIVSMEDRAAEHRAKLEAYRRDPEGNDDKGILKGKTPEVRERIINGRIKHLQDEINAWDKQVRDLRNKGR